MNVDPEQPQQEHPQQLVDPPQVTPGDACSLDWEGKYVRKETRANAKIIKSLF